MLDIGFSELLLIGGVALVVLGPEKLAIVARTTGKWAGKAQTYVNEVKSDIAREGELAELRKLKMELETAGQDIEQSFRQNTAQAENNLSALGSELEQNANLSSVQLGQTTLSDAQSYDAIQASLDSTSNYSPPDLSTYTPSVIDHAGKYTAPPLNDPIMLRMELDALNDDITKLEARMQQLKTSIHQAESASTVQPEAISGAGV